MANKNGTCEDRSKDLEYQIQLERCKKLGIIGSRGSMANQPSAESLRYDLDLIEEALKKRRHYP